MSNELNCRMGKDELTWSGAWWRRQSCGWLVYWLGNASFFPSVLLCFLSWSWFLVSGNFENENVRKNGLLNAFLLLSSSFLLLCEWFVPVLLVFIDLLCSLRYVSVRLLFAERQTKTMIYEVRALPSPVFWFFFPLGFAPVPPVLGVLLLWICALLFLSSLLWFSSLVFFLGLAEVFFSVSRPKSHCFPPFHSPVFLLFLVSFFPLVLAFLWLYSHRIPPLPGNKSTVIAGVMVAVGSWGAEEDEQCWETAPFFVIWSFTFWIFAVQSLDKL